MALFLLQWQRCCGRCRAGKHVEPGGQYLLVDDVSSLGGKLAELANSIQRQGMEMVNAFVLVNAGLILRFKLQRQGQGQGQDQGQGQEVLIPLNSGHPVFRADKV